MFVKLNIKLVPLATFVAVFFWLQINSITCEETDKLTATGIADNNRLIFPLLWNSGSPVFSLNPTGSCVRGVQYRITRVAELFSHIDDLECVFAAGLVPTSVGLGLYYHGVPLAAATSSTELPLFFDETNFVSKIECNHQQVFFGSNRFGIAEWKIQKFPQNSKEFDTESIVVQYGNELIATCPNLLDNTPFKYSTSPLSNDHFVDIGRLVGIDEEDGAAIIIMKRMIIIDDDETLRNNSSSTLLFYALKNFDPQSIPDGFVASPSITVKKSFNYVRQQPSIESLERVSAKSAVSFMRHMQENPSSSSLGRGSLLNLPSSSLGRGSLLNLPSSFAHQIFFTHLFELNPTNQVLLLSLLSRLLRLSSPSLLDSEGIEKIEQALSEQTSRRPSAETSRVSNNRQSLSSTLLDSSLLNSLSRRYVRENNPEVMNEKMRLMMMMEILRSSMKEDKEDVLNRLVEWMTEEGDGFGTYRRRLMEPADIISKNLNDVAVNNFQPNGEISNQLHEQNQKRFFEVVPNKQVSQLRQTFLTAQPESLIEIISEQPETFIEVIPQQSFEEMVSAKVEESSIHHQKQPAEGIIMSEYSPSQWILRVPDLVEQKVKNVVTALPGHAQSAAIIRAIGQLDTTDVWESFQPRKVLGTLLSAFPVTHALRKNQEEIQRPSDRPGNERFMQEAQPGNSRVGSGITSNHLRNFIPSLSRIS